MDASALVVGGVARLFRLNMDQDAAMSLFKLNITTPGDYAIISEVRKQLTTKIVRMASTTTFGHRTNVATNVYTPHAELLMWCSTPCPSSTA